MDYLNTLSRSELINILRDADIRGHSNLTRRQMIDIIIANNLVPKKSSSSSGAYCGSCGGVVYDAGKAYNCGCNHSEHGSYHGGDSGYHGGDSKHSGYCGKCGGSMYDSGGYHRGYCSKCGGGDYHGDSHGWDRGWDHGGYHGGSHVEPDFDPDKDLKYDCGCEHCKKKRSEGRTSVERRMIEREAETEL